MRLRVGERSYVGESVDLRRRVVDEGRPKAGDRDHDAASASAVAADSAPVDAAPIGSVPDARLAARIATAMDVDGSVPLRTDRPQAGEPIEVAVDCPSPAPGHERLRTHPVNGPLRTVLAAAARARGLTASVDEALADRRETLRGLEPPAVDLDAARERLATASGEEERLRERVAALRGELRARRDLDADVEAVQEALAEATTALSTAETERIAAEQALDRAVERAREARDARERRLELEDEVANLERDARRELAREIYPAVRDALEAIPGADPALAGDDPESFAGEVDAAGLAAVRAAELDAPVVLGPAVDRFRSAAAARDALGCPVVRV